MALLNHFICSIWVQWVLLICLEGSVWPVVDFGHAICLWLCAPFSAAEPLTTFYPLHGSNEGWLYDVNVHLQICSIIWCSAPCCLRRRRHW
jgi:hypothetical protein